MNEMEVTGGSFCDGVTLQDSGLREAAGLIVIAVRKPDAETTFNPTADTLERVLTPLLDEAHARVARAASAKRTPAKG